MSNLRDILIHYWQIYWQANVRLTAPLVARMTCAPPPEAYDAARTTLVRVYRGRGAVSAFNRDITRLAELGWRLEGTPSYGGIARERIPQIWLWGVYGSRRPDTLIATFSRSPWRSPSSSLP